MSLFTMRYLGPDNYGLISYASAYTGLLSSFSSLGINSVIVKEFVDRPNEEGSILGTSLGLRIASSLFSAMTIMCVSFLLDSNEPETWKVVALYSFGAVMNAFEVFNHWFQSQLQSKKTEIASMCAYAVMSGYKILLLVLNKPVTYFALATAVDYAVIAAILLFFYFKDKRGKLCFSWTYGKLLLSKSHHYILTGLMVSIYAQTDKLMLKQMIGERETGYYTTAVTLNGMWCFVLGAIINSMNPIIMQSHSNDKEKYDKLNKLQYSLVIYISAAAAIMYTVLGGWMIRILYGKAYLPAIGPLRILAWQTAFSYLGVARNTWIVCENKQKYLKYIYISAMLANVVLNYLWIPKYAAEGAAFASLITQIITVYIVPFLIPELRENARMMKAALFPWKIQR